MKSAIALLVACLVASSAAFSPMMMAAKAKVAPKKAAPKAKAAPKKAAPGLASKAKITKNVGYIYDDGLTDLERKQRATQPNFLTGSAKSRPDPSAIDPSLGDVGNSWSLTPQQTLVANCVALVGLLSIVNSIKY